MPSFAFVILVGGEGKRVSKIIKNKQKSKAELKITKNDTILQYQIKFLRKKKFKNLIFINSNHRFIYLKKIVKQSKIKKIVLLEEKRKLGTAGCLNLLKQYNYDFYVIIFGDILFNFNFRKLIKFHLKKKSDFTIVTHPNDHPEDSDCVTINKNSLVLKYYRKPKTFKSNLCSSGIYIINKKNLKFIPNNKYSDLSKNLVPKLMLKKKIYAYCSREYLKDIGTPIRFNEAKKQIRSNKYINGIIDKKVPAIFMDRDGVINFDNYKEGYQNPNKIIPGFLKANKLINSRGFLSILVTNQPSVAKGYISLSKLLKDFKNLEKAMSKNRTYFDKIYFCPCHPQRGFKGELKKFKRDCNWRKPNNGMIEDAIIRFNINRKKSFMIGDRFSDYLAAKKSNIKFIQVGNYIHEKKLFSKKNLLQAIKYIFKNKSC